MYVERIPNRNSPPAILLRESYRDGNKFRRRTLANLSHWPPARVEALRCVLRDEAVAPAEQDALTLLRSLPHGHVAAALGTLRKIGLDRVLSQGGVQPRRDVALCIAMIVARLIDPASKLATARGLTDDTASSSLGQVLGLGRVDEQELYETLDWLVGQQQRIERALARRHLEHGTLVLYDVTSTYFEGRTCPLAKRGYNRDGKRHKLQIVFGLMCTTQGCPVAVEVFEGNVGDPSTLANQIEKVKQRFGIAHIVLIGDRGMITEARINETIKPAGINFITALRAPAPWSRLAAFSCHCSISAISPRSAHPIIPASASSSVAIRCSRTSAAANGANSSMQPSRTCAKSRRVFDVPSEHCAAKKKLGSRWVRYSTITRWANISISKSQMLI